MRDSRLVLISFVSWIVGLLTYIASGYAGFGDGIGGGDIPALICWTPIPTTIAIWLVYTPCMLWLNRKLKGNKPVILFPLVGSLLFIVPATLVAMCFAGIGFQLINALLTPEAVLFYLMFIAVGFTYGLGFALFYPMMPANDSMETTLR